MDVHAPVIAVVRNVPTAALIIEDILECVDVFAAKCVGARESGSSFSFGFDVPLAMASGK
jgi:hypothetical protein